MQRSDTSSMSWSTIDPEKMLHVETKERKASQQAKSAMRGQRLRTSAIAAAMPSHSTMTIEAWPEPSQKRVGARHSISSPPAWVRSRAAKKFPRGTIPDGPTIAWLAPMIPAKTRMNTAPIARRTIHRGQRWVASPAIPENSRASVHSLRPSAFGVMGYRVSG